MITWKKFAKVYYSERENKTNHVCITLCSWEVLQRKVTQPNHFITTNILLVLSPVYNKLHNNKTDRVLLNRKTVEKRKQVTRNLGNALKLT